MINCVVNFFVCIADFAAYPIVSGIDRIRGLVLSFLGLFGNQPTGVSSLKEREIQHPAPPSSKGIANLFLSITGNPPHMGHMECVARAIEALQKKGYLIGQVRIALSSEEYAEKKVYYQNVSIQKQNEKISEGQKPEMLKVLIPREQRIEFLELVIQQAKHEKIFKDSLDIACVKGAPHWNSGKVFSVCGADFAVDEAYRFGEGREIEHAVIIGREGIADLKFTPEDEENDRKIFVKNDDPTREISSSKIQNGHYALLPLCIRNDFKKLHEAAPLGSPKAPIESGMVFDEEIEKIPYRVARDTKKAITQGFYVAPSGKKIKLRNGEALLEDTQAVPNAVLKQPVEKRYASDTEIIVVKQDCLEAARAELKGGAERVALLMLASPIEAGGAMEEENPGQEEGLCYRSNLFDFMWDQVRHVAKKELYPLVALEGSDQIDPDYASMAENKMLLVPQVTVFRAGKEKGYEMLEDPFEVGILVSSGLNRPRYKKSGDTWTYVRPEDTEQLRKLITTQLKVSYDAGYDTVILGAFGCGAFQNPPQLVASVYKQIIDEFFPKAFKRIVFAILDSPKEAHNPEGNVKPFQEMFS